MVVTQRDWAIVPMCMSRLFCKGFLSKCSEFMLRLRSRLKHYADACHHRTETKRRKGTMSYFRRQGRVGVGVKFEFERISQFKRPRLEPWHCEKPTKPTLFRGNRSYHKPQGRRMSSQKDNVARFGAMDPSTRVRQFGKGLVLCANAAIYRLGLARNQAQGWTIR